MRSTVPAMVTRLYRLARSIGDHLQHVARDPRPWRYLEGDRAAIDTSTAAGKSFLDMLGICRWARQCRGNGGPNIGNSRSVGDPATVCHVCHVLPLLNTVSTPKFW